MASNNITSQPIRGTNEVYQPVRDTNEVYQPIRDTNEVYQPIRDTNEVKARNGYHHMKHLYEMSSSRSMPQLQQASQKDEQGSTMWKNVPLFLQVK